MTCSRCRDGSAGVLPTWSLEDLDKMAQDLDEATRIEMLIAWHETEINRLKGKAPQ